LTVDLELYLEPRRTVRIRKFFPLHLWRRYLPRK